MPVHLAVCFNISLTFLIGLHSQTKQNYEIWTYGT